MKTKHSTIIVLLLPTLILLWHASVARPAALSPAANTEGSAAAPINVKGSAAAPINVKGSAAAPTSTKGSAAAPTPISAMADANGYGVKLVGHIGGAVEAVFVQDDRAYIGEGPRLTVLDISDPTAPTVLGRSAPGGEIVQDVYVAGSHAYAAAGADGLRVVDVSNPANPVEVGSVAFVGDSARGVVVADDSAYVSCYGSLWVVDVSNPTAPTRRGRYLPGGGPVAGLAVMGSYVYVTANYYGGADVVDVSNPDAPSQVTSLDTVSGSPKDVVIIGDDAYIVSRDHCTLGGCSPGGLFVFDVSDPANPVFVRYYDYPFKAYERVTAAGNTLYLLGNQGRLMAADVSDPTAPVRLGAYGVDDEASDVAVAGGLALWNTRDSEEPLTTTYSTGLAYVAEGSAGLRVVDVSQTAAEAGYYYPPGEAQKVVTGGQYAYVTVGDTLRVVDVSDPDAPQERSAYQPPASGYVWDAAAAGNHVYLIGEDQDYDEYLRILDVSNADAPLEVGSIGGDVWDFDPDALAVSGDYVYAVGHLDAFRVIDVSAPVSPTMVATHTLRGYDVAMVGRYAYVALVYPGGLKVLDILTPTAPLEVGTYTPAAPTYQTRVVAASGNHAYLAEEGQVTILDVADPSHPTPVGTYEIEDSVSEMTVAGTGLYLALGEEGLEVVDVSDPTQPREAVSLPHWTANGVTAASDRAYVAAGWKGFRVLDLSSLSLPVRGGAYNLPPANARSVAVAGNPSAGSGQAYAYVADYDNGLKVVNVSDPSAPAEVGSYDLADGDVEDVTVDGSYAYVAAKTAGLWVMDVSTPTSLADVGSYDTPGAAEGVAVTGTTAYVADGGYGLTVVDVSNPVTPTEIGRLFPWGWAYAQDVAVAGSTAYVAGSRGLETVDVSSPTTPTSMGFYTASSTSDVAVTGTTAYLAAGSDGLTVLDVSNPVTPTEVSSYARSGDPEDLVVVGGYAYVIEEYAGLRILDISNPSAPIEVGSYDERSVWEAAVANDSPGAALRRTQDTASLPFSEQAPTYAYLITDGGLAVVDVSNPSAPTEVGFYDTPGSARDVAVLGDHAYVADGDQGLRVIDVSTPSNPTEVGYYAASDENAYGVAITGDPSTLRLRPSTGAVPSSSRGSGHRSGQAGSGQAYAYVAQGYQGLRVVDVSNPSNPSEVGYYDLPYYEDMVAAGEYLYVAMGSRGLRALDISYPIAPVELDTMYGWPVDVAVVGDYAYTIDAREGLRVIDVSTPSDLARVASYEMENPAGVAAAGNYAYVADRQEGLVVMNVSDPSTPTGVGTYVTPGSATGVALAGHCAYLVDSDGKLRVMDVSDTSAPIQVGYHILPVEAYGVAAVDDTIYAADGAGGLFILQPIVYPEVLYLPLVTRNAGP